MRVATGYAAKIVCSNVFIAGRDAEQVLAVDVQAAGHPVLKLVRVNVDVSAGTVTARMLGLFATSIAIHRTGPGCASVPDGDVTKAQAVQLASTPQIAPPSDAVWPDGGTVEANTPELADIMGNAELAGPGMRAVVVVKGGRIVAEAYGEGVRRCDAAAGLVDDQDGQCGADRAAGAGGEDSGHRCCPQARMDGCAENDPAARSAGGWRAGCSSKRTTATFRT